MIKERELLETALGILEDYELGYGGDHHKSPEASILNDIRKLLTQPEQEHVGIVRTIGGYPDNSEHVVDWVCKYRDLKDGDRLYLAPPKREPLSHEHLEALVDKYHGYPMTLGRVIEKAHGIGGEE